MVFLTRILRCIGEVGHKVGANKIFKEPDDISLAFRKWYFGLSLYNKYGLYWDDIIPEDCNPEVTEAVRRLPSDVYDQRVFRIVRAQQLEITKTYLPKEQWITYEEDMTKGRYLQPYIDEVLAEWKEKEEWERSVH